MSIASDIGQGKTPANIVCASFLVKKKLKPIAELETGYYLRVLVADQPGVMAQLSGALGNFGHFHQLDDPEGQPSRRFGGGHYCYAQDVGEKRPIGFD
jgi:hypothetical protein